MAIAWFFKHKLQAYKDNGYGKWKIKENQDAQAALKIV